MEWGEAGVIIPEVDKGYKVQGETEQHMQESLGSKQNRVLGWREKAAGQPVTHSTDLESYRPRFESWLCSF